MLSSLALLLGRHGYRPVRAEGPAEALEALTREAPDLVLQDMNFSRETSGQEGLELLERLRAARPGMPVVLLTAWGSIDLAVAGMKAGASDFLTKPWSNERLLDAVATALELAAVRSGASRAPRSREALERRWDLTGILGRDPAWLAVLELAGRVAPTDASVLITGESGTGKELVAEAIHSNSRRAGGPFVKVNLGGISATLFESEMFGHVKGAFTDARERREGRFERAAGGTIFLDEIGELDPASQVKLLRVLQDRSFEVLGSSVTRRVDVRVISATNRTLDEEVEGGRFREDLLYRLNLITLHLPPLGERRGDIPEMAQHFLAEACERHREAPLTLTEAALDWLARRPWPGNVRQLRQTMERAALIAPGPESLGADELTRIAGPEPAGTGELPHPGAMTLEQMEREMIARCLAHYGGNLSRVARALGLSRPALYRRLEKYGLDAGGADGR